MAINSPARVTNTADIFRINGIVSTCVFMGEVQPIISIPATILPQAKRVIELITRPLFSLIGVNTAVRGLFIDAKKIIRKLYTVVKEVATRVKINAHEFKLEMFIASIIASLEKNPDK
mgnify:CR=1 FL=1